MPSSPIIQPTKSFLFLAILRNSSFVSSEKADSLVVANWGDFQIKKKIFFFPMQNYYAKEMGDSLEREIYVFETPVAREALIKAKQLCMSIENELSRDGKRTINMDPGLISLEQLTLISTKPFSHRIYLGNNLYGDLTYLYQNNKYNCLAWTYPDYKDQEVIEFFETIRKKLKKILFE